MARSARRGPAAALHAIAFHPVGRASGLRVLGLVLGVSASVVVSRLGGPGVKGIASTYAAANTLAFLVINLDLAQQILRDGRSRKDLRSVPPRIVRMWPIYGMLASIFILIGYWLNAEIAWLAIGTFAYLVSTQMGMVSNALAGPSVPAWGAVLQQAGMIAGAGAAASFGSLDGSTVRLVVVVSYLTPLPLFLWSAFTRRPVGELPKEPRQPALALVASGTKWQVARLAQFLMLRVDLLVVFFWLGPAAAGVYSVGLSTASLAGIVPAQFAANTTHTSTMGLSGSARTNARGAIVSGAVASLALVLVGYPLISIAYGPKFLDAYGVLVAAVVGVTGYGALQVLTAHARLVSGPRLITVSSVAGVAAMVLAMTILVPVAGIVGAALASSCGPAVALATAALIRRSEMR